MNTDTDNARNQAKAQLASISEMVANLTNAEPEDAQDDARQVITEDALSVQVRSDWHNPGEDSEASEFMILLCTGGPAVRIIGELSEYKEPESARLEYQDWGTPWTSYPLSE